MKVEKLAKGNPGVMLMVVTVPVSQAEASKGKIANKPNLLGATNDIASTQGVGNLIGTDKHSPI